MKKTTFTFTVMSMLLALSSCGSFTPVKVSEKSASESKSQLSEQSSSSSDDNTSVIKDEYDNNDRLILNLKNLYFEQWQGEDFYTDIINEKFGVSIKAGSYSWNDWDTMVNYQINSGIIPDAFHFELNSINYGESYERWSNGGILKPLPDDMSKWPNLQQMIRNTSNVDSLKINGKLYGIPIANDISNPEKDFSNLTYIYRRDWAKNIDKTHIGENGYIPIYKEGDVYTWDEFDRLLNAFLATFKTTSENNKPSVLVDESYYFPSVTNFFKDAPHCFAKDDSGRAINAFTSDKYISGLKLAKRYVNEDKFYSQDQFNFEDGRAIQQYINGQAAILYSNFSLSNYITLRNSFKRSQHLADLDGATAFLKIKGPDGKFALEGTENWYSMTMFNADISDMKLEKVLDILDYLLSEEGTRLAIYGKEGYDYDIVDGEVVINETNWEKDQSTGRQINKTNGAKYLRYMATLDNDTKAFDPCTDIDAYNALSNWQQEMLTAKNNGDLRVIKEPADIAWMSTPTKNDRVEGLLHDANAIVLKYCFNKIDSTDSYKAEFDKNTNWKKVLDEINSKLGK